ncbi:hypothetical protein Lal_00021497 [Lupinus albus]|nr:hypothetical protein Lal_00021497 [Lupinus albus]
MAHSLNPRYYSDEWIQEAPNRHAPHEDEEIFMERNKCLKKLFRNDEDRKQVSLEYANFSSRCAFYNYSRNMACLKSNIGRLEHQPTSDYEEHMWRRSS